MDPGLFATIFLPIAAAQFVGWAVPGPNHLTIATASVTGGRKSGLLVASGVTLAAVTWTLIAVSGIAVVFELYPPLFTGIRLAGALYLAYLGLRSFRSIGSGGMMEVSSTTPPLKKPLLTGYLVMMTNPKAVLFFGSVLTAFVPADGNALILFMIVVQFGIIGSMLNGFAAIFFSIPSVVRGFQAAGKVMTAVFAILFLGLGLFVGYDTLMPFFTA